MREILFKAKRADTGEWVEGYYIYHINRTICPIGDSIKPEDEQHVIMQDGFSDWNMPRDTDSLRYHSRNSMPVYRVERQERKEDMGE